MLITDSLGYKHCILVQREQTTHEHAHLYAQMETLQLPTHAYGPDNPHMKPALTSAAEVSLIGSD